MLNRTYLKKIIKDRHANTSFLAHSIGCSRASMYNKMNGETEFTESEIITMVNVLQLSAEERDNLIFLN